MLTRADLPDLDRLVQDGCMSFSAWASSIIPTMLLVSSCTVREDYHVESNGDSGISLHKTETYTTWWGDVPKDPGPSHPLGSPEGNDSWTVSSQAAAAGEQRAHHDEERFAEQRFGHKR